jgi:hypothetical protein
MMSIIQTFDDEHNSDMMMSIIQTFDDEHNSDI